MRRVIPIGAVVAVAAAVSSCGGGSHAATVSAPVLEGRATVSGAYSFSAPFHFGSGADGPRATCSHWTCTMRTAVTQPA